MLEIKDAVDLISKLEINNKKEKEKQLEDYIKNLKDLYKEILKALDDEEKIVRYRWFSGLPDIAKKLKFKVYQIIPIDETFGGYILITKRGIKKLTKEMIKYNLVEKEMIDNE